MPLIRKILLILSALLISCSTTNLPDRKVKIFVGNSKTSSIIREKAKEQIYCDNEDFDKVLCLQKEDFMIFMNKCKDKE